MLFSNYIVFCVQCVYISCLFLCSVKSFRLNILQIKSQLLSYQHAKTFSDYKAEAATILSGFDNLPPDLMAALAFSLGVKDVEAQGLLEKELLKQQNERDKFAIKTCFLKKLESISQRSLIESTFRRIVDFSRIPGNKIHLAAIKHLDKFEQAVLNDRYPRMNAINRMLVQNINFREVVWDVLGFEKTLEIPVLPEEKFLYGVLSEDIHDPPIANVYMSSDIDDVRKAFFIAMSVLNKKPIVTLDVEIILEGDNIVGII